jgi:hypothetical protein
MRPPFENDEVGTAALGCPSIGNPCQPQKLSPSIPHFDFYRQLLHPVSELWLPQLLFNRSGHLRARFSRAVHGASPATFSVKFWSEMENRVVAPASSKSKHISEKTIRPLTPPSAILHALPSYSGRPVMPMSISSTAITIV